MLHEASERSIVKVDCHVISLFYEHVVFCPCSALSLTLSTGHIAEILTRYRTFNV